MKKFSISAWLPLTAKKFFLIFRWHFLCFGVSPLLLVLYWVPLKKAWLCLICILSSSICTIWWVLPLNLFFSSETMDPWLTHRTSCWPIELISPQVLLHHRGEQWLIQSEICSVAHHHTSWGCACCEKFCWPLLCALFYWTRWHFKLLTFA